VKSVFHGLMVVRVFHRSKNCCGTGWRGSGEWSSAADSSTVSFRSHQLLRCIYSMYCAMCYSYTMLTTEICKMSLCYALKVVSSYFV